MPQDIVVSDFITLVKCRTAPTNQTRTNGSLHGSKYLVVLTHGDQRLAMWRDSDEKRHSDGIDPKYGRPMAFRKEASFRTHDTYGGMCEATTFEGLCEAVENRDVVVYTDIEAVLAAAGWCVWEDAPKAVKSKSGSNVKLEVILGGKANAPEAKPTPKPEAKTAKPSAKLSFSLDKPKPEAKPSVVSESVKDT